MTEQIIYREMGPGDYDELLKLVIDTWQYADWVTAKLVAPLAEKFMVETLLHSSLRTVAVHNGKIAGIIAVGTGTDDAVAILCKSKELDALLRLTSDSTNEGKFLHQYLETKQLNLDMLKSRYDCYQGVINLLIVKKEYKGFGIGSTLFNRANRYFYDNRVSRFYLFSDSASNVFFYEKKGMERVSEISYKWDKTDDDSNEEYYMYEGITLI